MEFDVNKIWETVLAVLLAVAGGLARLLTHKNSSRMKRGRVFGELFVAGFVGIITLMVARELGLTGDWLGVLSGMAGYAGPRVVDMLLEKYLPEKMGIDLIEKEK